MLAQVRKFGGDQKRFLASQMITSTYNNLISGVLMTGLLLYIGVRPSRIGVFLSIPLLANILQLAIGKMWNWFYNYKKMINCIVLAARFGILSIVGIPILFRDSGQPVKIWMTAMILTVSYTFASSAGIHLNLWMVQTIPAEKQGTFFAFRDRMVVGVTMLISFGAAYLIDQLKVANLEYIGFATAFLIASLLAVIDYTILRKISYERNEEKKERLEWPLYWKVIKEDRRFLRFLIYMLVLSLGMNLANPYYNTYMLDCLELKYTHIMCLTGFQVCVQIAVSSIWGKIANRIRWSRILNVTVFILGVQFFIWAMVTKESIGLIYVIFISSGLISTGLVTGQFMIQYEFIGHQNTMVYLSLCACVTALGGFSGSLLGSGIISAFADKVYQLGGIGIGSMQINMIISGSILLVSVFYAKIVLNRNTERSYYVG